MSRSAHVLAHPATAALLALLAATPALAEADGPDAWQVTGVSASDRLNVRMGPGTEYPEIGSLAPGSRHLTNITCTPIATMAQYADLTAAEQDRLPSRWCLVFDSLSGLKGWVAGRFLMEDTARSGRGAATAPASASSEPPPFDIAVPLVRNMYRSWRNTGSSLLRDRGWLNAYFFAGLADRLYRGVDWDPLFGGQDSNVTGDISVAFDPGNPTLQGTTNVVVDLTNWDTPQTVHVHLRADPEQGGAIRVFCIEQPDGSAIGC